MFIASFATLAQFGASPTVLLLIGHQLLTAGVGDYAITEAQFADMKPAYLALYVRGILPYLFGLLRLVNRRVSARVAAHRVLKISRLLNLSGFLLFGLLHFFLHKLFVILVLALPLSFSLAVILVFGPILVSLNIGAVSSLIFFFVEAVYGIKVIGNPDNWFLIGLRFFSSYPGAVVKVLDKFNWVLSFIVQAFVFIYLAVTRFVFLIWVAVVGDARIVLGHQVQSTFGKIFLFRCSLAYLVFIFTLLGAETIMFLWSVAVVLTFAMMIAFYMFVSTFRWEIPSLLLNIFLLLVLSFWNRGRMAISGFGYNDDPHDLTWKYLCIAIMWCYDSVGYTEVKFREFDDRASFFAPPISDVQHSMTLERARVFAGADDCRDFVLSQVRLITPLFSLSLFVLSVLTIALYLLRGLVSVGRGLVFFPYRFVKALHSATFVFLIPDPILFGIYMGVQVPFAILWNAGVFGEVHKYLRMLGLSMVYGYTYLSLPFKGDVSGDPDRENLSKVFVRSWVSLTRRSVLRFMEKLDSIRLPEMIQSAYNPPDLESIRSTYSLLGDMGFAVDQSFVDSLSRPESSPYLAEWGSWKKWMLGTSNFALGFRKLSTSFHSWLPHDFYPDIPGYIHSGTFTGVSEEIISTARYYTGNDELKEPDDFQLLYDDLWEAVKVQYANSKLSSFEEIYRNWTKRFNMGFGFGSRKRSGKLYQATRQSVIEAMGGKRPFLKAWEKVFYNAQKLLLPSPVFTKWETLKLKKALSRSVRTVVGSSFVHHVMTTVFNYKPNHNYHPWETPMKVGMPLNGQNFNRVWESLLGFEKVWAGDMSAFDSSQSPFMLRMVAEIRKRGFELHQDYDKICQLIDISYEMLINQPMGFKNFGDISFKAQGATTGHSSTTPDNSMMLVANYLFAWRHVTGLRARDFFNFNSLSNFGDDHVLGYDPVFGWSPQAAILAMKKLGTVMRDEAPGQDCLPRPGMVVNGLRDPRLFPFSFLSKKPVPIDSSVQSELRRANVTVPLTFATVHDRDRLIGKIKGLNLESKMKRTLASYDALISYLYLTAHQKDIYDKLISSAVSFHRQNLHLWLADGVKPNQIKAPPSYNQVLRQWYSGEPFPYADAESEEAADEHLELTIINSPDTFGVFVRWLSDFPTLLSPRYSNTRWADWIQRKLGDYLSWPLTFLAKANGVPNDLYTAKLLLARSPYSFLRNETIRLQEIPFGTLLVRHWLFMTFSRFYSRRKFFTIFDLFRLLDSFYINTVFMLTGRLSQIVVELDLHIIETVILFLLNFVSFDIEIPPIAFDLLSPSVLVARFLSFSLRFLTPSGAIDFQPFDEAVKRLSNNIKGGFALQAPTGVGKSTRLMFRLMTLVKRRVVVIVPRHLVCVGVGQYMQKLYPDCGIGIATEGFKFRHDDSLIYCTAQSFLLNPSLRTPGSVIVLDEAHINEAHYMMVKTYLRLNEFRTIFVTATPLEEFPLPLLRLPANNQNVIVDVNHKVDTLDHYLEYAAMFCNDRVSLEKVLVFCPTKAMIEKLRSRILHRVCVLSSEDRFIDNSATVFISTSVSDAGLTIPDVQFVLSTDVDIFIKYDLKAGDSVDTVRLVLRGVSSPTNKGEPKFFRIPHTTVQQRRGRTGRTTDGTFMLFHVSDIVIEDRVLSVMDYLNECRSDYENLGKFIPQSLLKSVAAEYLPTIFELVPGASFETLTTLSRRVDKEFSSAKGDERSLEKKLLFLRDFLTQRLVRYNAEDPIPNPPEVAPEELVIGHKPVEPTVNVRELASVVKPVGVFRPRRRAIVDDNRMVNEHRLYEEPPSSELLRRNVSGSGLLCGARVLIGLYYTYFRLVLPEDRVLQLIRRFVPPGLEHEYQDFFSVDQLMAAGAALGFDIDFYDHGVLVPSLVPDRDRLPYGGVIYLDDGHYNYSGREMPISIRPLSPQLLEMIFNGLIWIDERYHPD